MASKLIPSDPEKVMVIRKVTPDIMTCSTPFLRFGRIKVGGRGTIVRLQSGALAVFSPVALTDSVKKEMQSLSPGAPVRYLTALDQEHHIFLEDWHKAYPDAKIIMPETLPNLRDKQTYFKLPTAQTLLFKSADKTKGFKVSEEFDREFDMEYADGHANHELVFNHKPSKTLIEADLIFNLPATEQMSKTNESPTSGLLTKLMCSLQSTKGTAIWQRRMLWYAISASDRKGFNESMARIDKWNFDRMIPCHGDVIETGAKGLFQKIMQWHLEAAKKGQ